MNRGEAIKDIRQTTIYDYIGIESDPIFEKIRGLEIGESLQMGSYKVSKNEFGMYELETRSQHDSAHDLIDFYNKIIILSMDL